MTGCLEEKKYQATAVQMTRCAKPVDLFRECEKNSALLFAVGEYQPAGRNEFA